MLRTRIGRLRAVLEQHRAATTAHVDEQFEAVHEAIAAAAAKAESALEECKGLRTDVKAIAANVSRLASARLLQQALTSVVLAALLYVGVRAFGG